MPLKEQKTGKPFPTGTSRDYPDMPQFPSDLSQSARDDYNQKMQEWWGNLKDLHRSIDDDIASKKSI